MARIRAALAFAAFTLLAASPATALIGENLIQQPTFDEGINGWDNLGGKLWEQADDCRPLPEQPNPGSLEMLADDYVRQCIGIIGDQRYHISFHVKVMMTDPEGAFGLFGLGVQWHSNFNCTAYMEGPIIHPFSYYTGATDWHKMEIEGHAPLAAQSALVTLAAQKTAGSPDNEVRVRFDDVVFAPISGITTTTITTTSTTTTTTEETTTTTDEPNAPGCADPVLPYDKTTVSDALYVLRASIHTVVCDNCYCDTDGSGKQTVADALRTLRLAVGHSVTKTCGACEA